MVCYGSALSETAGWYESWINMLTATYPWFVRELGSDNFASSGGLFTFHFNGGNAADEYGVRAALT